MYSTRSASSSSPINFGLPLPLPRRNPGVPVIIVDDVIFSIASTEGGRPDGVPDDDDCYNYAFTIFYYHVYYYFETKIGTNLHNMTKGEISSLRDKNSKLISPTSSPFLSPSVDGPGELLPGTAIGILQSLGWQ